VPEKKKHVCISPPTSYTRESGKVGSRVDRAGLRVRVAACVSHRHRACLSSRAIAKAGVDKERLPGGRRRREVFVRIRAPICSRSCDHAGFAWSRRGG